MAGYMRAHIQPSFSGRFMNSKKKITGPVRVSLVALSMLGVLGGCASVPVIDATALPAIPEAFREADPRWTAALPAEAQAHGDWWRAFADPVLDDLVERANTGNTTIQQAGARLAQAKALLQGADANRTLQVSANAGASRQGGSLINAIGGSGTLFNTSVNLSYETDLFGRLAKASDAAGHDAKGREALMQSARLAVQTEVAQTYFSMRGLDTERAVLRTAMTAQRAAIGLNERRVRAGLISDIDVERQRMSLTATEADLATLERQRAQSEHALAVLVGEAASSFAVAERDWTGELPVIPPGIPSTLLARRPDVSAAQSSILSARAHLGASQAAWFPSLSLTTSGGYASPDLSGLFKLSLLDWAIGGVMSLPLFDGGRRHAGLKGAAAEVDLSLAAYREQVLIAFRDVEDQLASLRILSDQADIQQRALTSAARITKLSDSRFRSGLSSKLEVLDARQSELLSERKVVQVRASQYQVTVALVKALGGGW
jgi:outer membrane protein, multidrug efflux system